MRTLATKAEFDNAMNESMDKLVVIDFTATWCVPCQRIAPVFKALSREFQHVSFAKVDVDENQETAQECQVSAMPTFKGYKDKREIFSIRGADEAGLRSSIAEHQGSKFQGEGQRLGATAAYSFVLVKDLSTLTSTSIAVERFSDTATAQKAANELWCSWVLYEEIGNWHNEIKSGGVGWGHGRCRDELMQRKQAARRRWRMVVCWLAKQKRIRGTWFKAVDGLAMVQRRRYTDTRRQLITSMVAALLASVLFVAPPPAPSHFAVVLKYGIEFVGACAAGYCASIYYFARMMRNVEKSVKKVEDRFERGLEFFCAFLGLGWPTLLVGLTVSTGAIASVFLTGGKIRLFLDCVFLALIVLGINKKC